MGGTGGVSRRAWMGLGFLAAAMGLLLFVPSGTLHYWQAWIYLSIFFGASTLTTLHLARRDPALLERRLRSGPVAEQRSAQKFIMLFTSLGFVALLVVPALDRRYGWSSVPLYGVSAGDALVAIGLYFIFLVHRENSFSSATVQIAPGQAVVSTGPYAIVRHPMYASGALYLLGTPLALGSYWGFVPIAAMVPFLIWRLIDEERLLCEQLAGYLEYERKVPHRLIPGIW